jgi:chaperone BCS1
VYKDIQEFQNNKKAYERTGRPWTYTILNEGPPGVGKTKLVKAVAALTGYTLIVINLNHIPNAQVLYEAFHMSSLAGECVPHDKRLYYIPEVDTQIHSILKARDTAKLEINLVSLEDTKPKKEDKKPNIEMPSTKPTLGEILNVIDGIPERHGHILIMDTNCLKDLDPALIRPGRVDRILSWKPMSSLCVKQYLENYYETTLPKRVSLPNRMLTAAKLQSIVAGSPTLEHCLLTLKN